MADVLVNALTPISTEPISTDSLVCVNRSTNEGQIIDYNLLADKILDKLTSKTFSGLDTTAKIIPDAIDELHGLSAPIIPFQLGNTASYSFTMNNNFAMIAVLRDGNYQLLYLQYWWSVPVTVFTYGTTLLTVTKAANSLDVTITNTQTSQTCGLIFNPSAALRVS